MSAAGLLRDAQENVQVQGITLCETHRLVQAIQHILEELQRMPRTWGRER
jgi:hypothetical protein